MRIISFYVRFSALKTFLIWFWLSLCWIIRILKPVKLPNLRICDSSCKLLWIWYNSSNKPKILIKIRFYCLCTIFSLSKNNIDRSKLWFDSQTPQNIDANLFSWVQNLTWYSVMTVCGFSKSKVFCFGVFGLQFLVSFSDTLNPFGD